MSTKKLTSQQKKIVELERRLVKAKVNKKQLAQRLAKVKKAYTSGKISRQAYLRQTKHRSYHKYDNYYDNYIKKVDSKLREYKRSIISKELTKQILALLLIIITIASLGTITVGPSSISGAATALGTESRAVIQQYFAIALSDNLADGIEFGLLDQNTFGNNATDNYNGVSNVTTTYIELSNNSNVNVELCIRANADLHNIAENEIIGITNMTYTNATATDLYIPSKSDEAPLTKAFDKILLNVGPGTKDYLRFWLDIPEDTAPGTYNNTLEFKGVKTGDNC
jgi:hypothetical protein